MKENDGGGDLPPVIAPPVSYGTGENGKSGEDPDFSTPFLLIRNA
jgi:hypothetical protein